MKMEKWAEGYFVSIWEIEEGQASRAIRLYTSQGIGITLWFE